MSIYVEVSGKIFETDLSAEAATYIHWHFGCFGSRVAITVWLITVRRSVYSRVQNRQSYDASLLTCRMILYPCWLIPKSPLALD